MATVVAGVAVGAALTAVGGYTLYKLLAYLKRRDVEHHSSAREKTITFKTQSGGTGNSDLPLPAHDPNWSDDDDDDEELELVQAEVLSADEREYHEEKADELQAAAPTGLPSPG